MAVADIVKDLNPDFESLDSAKLDRFVGYAELQVYRTAWGNKADMATALLAAHLLTRAAPGSGAGAVTQEKIADVSVSYATPMSDDDLETTPFGKQFNRLRKTIVIGPLLT